MEGRAARSVKKPAARHIPEATVARLPVYVRTLLGLADEKTSTISSEWSSRRRASAMRPSTIH